jgi:hypothetical protein
MGSEQADSDQAGRGHRTQIIVALIAAFVAIFTTILGIAFRNPRPSPPPSPTSSPSAQNEGPKLANLSPGAQALLDKGSKDCEGSAAETPKNESVAITSPSPGAVVGEHPKVQGTVNLAPTEYLYFFVHSPDICYYYFTPYGPISPGRDGSWDVDLNLSYNRGEKVVLFAAVVGPEGHALFGEVLRSFTENPWVLHLPPSTQTAHISVRVAS